MKEVEISPKNETDTMSVEECRKYLGDIKLSDAQVENLRDVLNVFVDSSLDDYFSQCNLEDIWKK